MKKLSQFKEGLNSYKDISFYLKRKSKKNLNIRINAKNEDLHRWDLDVA